jgi:hypothetical protein
MRQKPDSHVTSSASTELFLTFFPAKNFYFLRLLRNDAACPLERNAPPAARSLAQAMNLSGQPVNRGRRFFSFSKLDPGALLIQQDFSFFLVCASTP